MRIWIVKRKGANQWYNLVSGELIVGSEKINYGRLFIRKKDAKLYLESFGEHKEFYEIIGTTLGNKKVKV